MLVIVKGMEMPKHCYDCPLQDGETGRCNILGITVYDIPKECPLVEVVRCKDCERWVTFDRNKAEYGLCQKRSQLEATKKNDFCSHAERKAE